MIAEAESRISGNGSILSYGMKMRRDTAEEILRFIKSLARTAATDAPVREHRLRSERWVRFPRQFGGLAKVDSGFGHAASFSVGVAIA